MPVYENTGSLHCEADPNVVQFGTGVVVRGPVEGKLCPTQSIIS